MIFEITSKNNQKIKYINSLKDKKTRNQEGVFISEGRKTFEIALEKGLVKEVFTYKKMKLPKEIDQYIVTEEVMKKISSQTNPEGVVFVCEKINYSCREFKKVVYLDDINDPGNLGTIIRTASALGFDAVVLSENTVDMYNPKVIAASKGSLFTIPVLIDKLSNYKTSHKIIVSSLEDNSISLGELKNDFERFVLVLGNESHGVSKETISLADVIVKIPISNIESLNVAIASAILMYELLN